MNLEALAAALPDPSALHTDPATLHANSGDKWFATAPPHAVVIAPDTATVSAVLRYATANHIPVTPRGAGIGYVGGCVPIRGGIVLSLAKLDRILEISAPDGLAVVQPGVITGHLQSEVRKQRLFYPPDPASLKECSLGGNIATNAGGPRCLKYGVTRPYVLGLEAVLPTGEIIRAGGRTHKNKTGFDLVGLFVGSEGLLGVVTEITLRLIPLPPARATLSASFTDISSAAHAVQAILHAGFLPAALEIADAFTLHAARLHAPDAATLVPPGHAHLLIELDGQENSVRSETNDLANLLRTLPGHLTLDTAHGETECERLWELRRAFSYSLRATGLKKLNEDIVVPRGRLVDLMNFAATLEKRHGVPVACFGHAGDGNIHVNLMVPPGDTELAAEQNRMTGALDELFAQVLAWGGAITGEHGIGLAKKRWWPQALSPEAHALHQTLKNALDPARILNPGKFLDE